MTFFLVVFTFVLSLFSQASPLAAGKLGFYLLVDDSGKVWSWGCSNKYGQLGHGDQEKRQKPEIIPSLSNIEEVCAGHSFALALDQRGQVFVWGENVTGIWPEILKSEPRRILTIPIPHPHFTNMLRIAAADRSFIALDQMGDLWGNRNIDAPILEEKNIVEISAGTNHFLALDQEGKVWSFGHNANGECGLGHTLISQYPPAPIPNLPPIKAIGAGEEYSIALDVDGKVWVWGRRFSSYYGLASTSLHTPSRLSFSEVSQISAGAEHALLIEHERVWAFGRNNNKQCNSDNDLKINSFSYFGLHLRALWVFAGDECSFAINREGKLQCWGNLGLYKGTYLNDLIDFNILSEEDITIYIEPREKRIPNAQSMSSIIY